MERFLHQSGYLQRLERLRLEARRLSASAWQHAPRRRASSGVVRDRRPYAPGDPLRSVDWPLLARSGRLYTRLYEERAPLRVSFLLDTSASMGSQDGDKLRCGQRLAGALSFLALSQGDEVQVLPFDQRLRDASPRLAGRRQVYRALDQLERLEAAGETGLARAVDEVLTLMPRGGRVVVVSDLWGPQGDLEALRLLPAAGLDPIVVQLVHREDREPPPGAGALLRDRESGEEQLRALDAEIRQGYRDLYQRWRRGIEDRLRRGGLLYLVQRIEEPFEQAVRTLFRSGRFLP